MLLELAAGNLLSLRKSGEPRAVAEKMAFAPAQIAQAIVVAPADGSLSSVAEPGGVAGGGSRESVNEKNSGGHHCLERRPPLMSAPVSGPYGISSERCRRHAGLPCGQRAHLPQRRI